MAFLSLPYFQAFLRSWIALTEKWRGTAGCTFSSYLIHYNLIVGHYFMEKLISTILCVLYDSFTWHENKSLYCIHYILTFLKFWLWKLNYYSKVECTAIKWEENILPTFFSGVITLQNRLNMSEFRHSILSPKKSPRRRSDRLAVFTLHRPHKA